MGATDADELDWEETHHGDARFRRKNLGLAAGGQQLGCSLYEIPPGSKDWPYHFHHGNEEAVFVLEGEGTIQTPRGHEACKRGTYIALPAGAENAHRIHNTGKVPLRFLCMSTMRTPDVAEYPETGRIGIYCGAAPGGPKQDRTRSAFYLAEGTVGYWP